MKLKNKQIHISDISKDDEEAMIKERECVYCGSKKNLSIDHIIPLIKGGPDMTCSKALCCKICKFFKAR
jgi:5-methylcytosine-specific restriction endonuclease McrA